MHALAAAHELRLDAVIDQLLQDFLQVCPDDYSQQFVSECLPLLFNIFRYSKVSSMTLTIRSFSSNFWFKLAERRNNSPVGGHLLHLLWLGTDQSDQGTGPATCQWIAHRSEICEQPRIE
jgi:hypothetical protein